MEMISYLALGVIAFSCGAAVTAFLTGAKSASDGIPTDDECLLDYLEYSRGAVAYADGLWAMVEKDADGTSQIAAAAHDTVRGAIANAMAGIK